MSSHLALAVVVLFDVCSAAHCGTRTSRHVRKVPKDSDVPSQALNARLIALLLPFWLEGLGDKSCRGEGGDLKTSVIKL